MKQQQNRTSSVSFANAKKPKQTDFASEEDFGNSVWFIAYSLFLMLACVLILATNKFKLNIIGLIVLFMACGCWIWFEWTKEYYIKLKIMRRK